jgi:restriction system protein
VEAPSADKEVSITYEQAEEQSWEEISQYLRKMNPYDFQELVAGLLRGMGYHVSWVAPPGKDGGIDIHAFTDPLGTQTPRIKVQVKRVKENVSVEGLRSFMAILGDDDVGLFVTTGGFTKDAQDEARIQQKRKSRSSISSGFTIYGSSTTTIWSTLHDGDFHSSRYTFSRRMPNASS